MSLDDLDLRDLLEFDPKGGVLRFAGQRALLLDAVALGLLRQELISSLGVTVARQILTRFGFLHGWRTAENMKDGHPWTEERDWRVAGGRLHMLQGLVVSRPPVNPSPGAPFAESLWSESYEAEQHLLHLGLADHAVCWTLCGFASGYLSFANGREIYCLEEKCRGKGDTICHMVGRTREEWGEAMEPHLPFYRKECLEATVARATSSLKKVETRLRRQRRELGRVAADIDEATGIVARSSQMKQVLSLARRVAKVDATVLVTGESGVGKERVARLIHDESARSSGPFVAVNAGAVTETLLESELFGHARGAFTGATHDRLGMFEAAQGGTLFLDEVGEIPAAMQAKLLRTLQEREVRRVGENKTRKVDVRVVAATNRNLATEVAEGRFRKDLYYRLKVVEIVVPALRERREDVLPLARALLAHAAEQAGRRLDGLSPRAADQLVRHDWPGNVRELGNAMERAVALAEGQRVELDDLPEEVRAALPASVPTGKVRSLADLEKEYILAVLGQNEGNQARTAEQLGIGTATLYRKLKQWKQGGRGKAA